MPSSKELPPLHKGFARLFVENRYCHKPQHPSKDTDLSGNIAIITGANTGLGLEGARQLLDLRLTHLIMAVRSLDKGEAAATDLRKQFDKAVIEVWQLDMSSYASVQALARRAEQQLDRIDIVILNAGIASNNFRIASTCHEEILQVNYISTVLLAALLLPALKAKRSATGRPAILTIVNSALALMSAFKNRNEDPLLPSFDEEKNFDSADTYNTSKTLGQLWLYKAADYISAEDVVLSLVDPGYIKGTNLQRDQPFYLRPSIWLMESLVAKTAKTGASCYVDAVVTKDKESHGCFLMNWEVAPFHDMLYTSEGKNIANRLWTETMQELSFANVEAIFSSMKGPQR